MRKSEIKRAENNDLIVDYVSSYSSLTLNYNLGRGVTQLDKHCKDLEEELVKRNILTEENIKSLNG